MSTWPRFLNEKPRKDNVIHIAPQASLDDRVVAVERAQDAVRATHEAHEAAKQHLMHALQQLRDEINSRQLGLKAEIEP